MSIFERIFGGKETQTPPAAGTVISDIVSDWFNESNYPVSDFVNNVLEPVIELSKGHPYTAALFLENEDETTRIYFDALAILYLAGKTRSNPYLEKIFYCFFGEGTESHDVYRVKDLVFRNPDHRFSKDHPAAFASLSAGLQIVKCYHAIHCRKDVNISYIDSVAGYLKQNRFNVNSLYFDTVLDYIGKQDFTEKPYVLLQGLISGLDYPGIDPETISSRNARIKEVLQKSVDQYNTAHKPSLDFDMLCAFGVFLSFEYGETWKNTPYKKRDDLKVKDLEECRHFIEYCRGKEATAVQNIAYCISNGSLYLYEKLLAEACSQIIAGFRPEKQWLEMLLLSYERRQGFFIKNVYTPLLRNIEDRLSYSDPLIALFEQHLFRNIGRTYPEPFTEAISLLKGIACKIEEEEEKALYLDRLHPYAAKIADGDMFFNLCIDEKDKSYSTFRAIIDELNYIIPVAFKGVQRANHFYEGSGIRNFTVNHKGKDMDITSAFVREINQLLEQENSGYRFVPIPLLQGTNKYQNHYFTATFAFLSFSGFNYLMEHYVSKRFKAFLATGVYDAITYEVTDAVPFYQFKAERQTAKKQTASGKFLSDINWSWFREKYIDQLKNREQWYAIMESMVQYTGSKKPNKKWLDEAAERITALGKENYAKEAQVLLSASLKEDFWYFEYYRNALKALLWTLACVEPTDESLNVVRMIVEHAYTKISGTGPRCTAIGNAGLEALAASGREEAFGILNIMRNKSKYNRFVTAIEKHIDKFRESSDMPEELLADKAIPRFGFGNGVKTIDVDSCRLQLTFDGNNLNKVWMDAGGKKCKSVPAALKENHPKLVKEATEEAKQVGTVFSDLKKRIRYYWLYNRTWEGKDWLSYIFEHPLIHPHIQNQVWTNKTRNLDFIVRGNELLSMDDKPVSVSPSDCICFWHPVENREENVNGWQEYTWKHHIVQAERQAFREHYPFSGTELSQTQTERFAHHFLEVKKLMAIAGSAGWIFTYVHEDVSWPRIYIKALDITAHLVCDYNRFDFAVPTKELFFTRGNTTKITWGMKPEKMELGQVPLSTLSEICRDIDLFIATTSAGNNPALSAERQELGNYRMDYEEGLFSDNASAKVRKRILEKLVPVLKINSPGFEGNYLVVNGKLNDYRINLGSGFAQVRESQKHISLLPSLSGVINNKKVRLPIEDDDTLYIIIAKALYLQNDEQISDPKIKELIVAKKG